MVFINQCYKTFFEAELNPRGCVTLAYLFDVSIIYFRVTTGTRRVTQTHICIKKQIVQLQSVCFIILKNIK